MRRRLILVAGLFLATASCGRRSREDPDAFQWQDQLPAGATIHVRNMDGQIEVVPADDATASVHGTTRWSRGSRDAVQFAWMRAGNDVYVCAVWGKKGQCDEKGYRSSRPGRSWLDMFSLFRRGSDAVASFTVELPRGVRVDASTITGSVHIEGATAGASAVSTNGGVVIESSAGATVAKSTNGNVHVSLDSIGDDEPIRLESVNGNVSAELPADTEGEVRLTTTNGHVRSEFDVQSGRTSSRSVRGRIGHSSREIVLRTTNGDATLRKHDSDDDADNDSTAEVTPTPPTPPVSPTPPGHGTPRARGRARN